MSKLIDIFLQPGRVFAAEQQRPTFLAPALVLAGLSAAFTLAYFLRVDPAWFLDQTLAAAGDLTVTEQARMREGMPGARVMGVIGAVGGVVGLAVLLAATALYVWLAGRVAGAPLTYRHGLSLATWTGMPMALGLLVALVGALTMQARTPIESLMLTNIDPLLVELPTGHRWDRVAQSISLITPWSVWLFALGWRLWTRSGWVQAVLVALVPTLVATAVIAALG